MSLTRLLVVIALCTLFSCKKDENISPAPEAGTEQKDQNARDQSTAKIQDQWLDRVKQVVQYCIDDSLYVILNIHWDGGWLDGNINTRSQASVNAKQKAFWEQIATKMCDFDEHLLFASANEPPVEDATQMSIHPAPGFTGILG